MSASSDELSVFLLTMPANQRERRLALAVVLISAVVFLALAPFAKISLPQVPAFIPIYESALVINDLITAVLLFGQFNILRSKALLVLASGYGFTACMTVAHALTFPGLFAPGGLLGAGPHSTAWMYMFWHGGFPLFVIAFALLQHEGHETNSYRGSASKAMLASIAAVLIAALALTAFATAGKEFLPAIMRGDYTTLNLIAVVSVVWVLSLIALIVLWRRCPRSVLNIWSMVVMCAWLFDIALAAILNAGRFDLGFYAGRIYGLLAASFVLMVLLLENAVLYSRLAVTHRNERSKTAALESANKELEAFSYSVSHDLRSPLRAVEGYTRMLQEDYEAQLDDEGKRLLGVVRSSSRRMGQLIDDLLAFSRLGRQPVSTRQVRLDDLVRQTIVELRADTDVHGVEFVVDKLGDAEADPTLLKQVLLNLLSNAVKFTRNQPDAVVEVGCRDAGPDNASRIYFVKDNGAGFDMRYADKLFGVFQRLHSIEEYEGTGVGLAIVQRLIMRHGGRVWAEAKPGEGATFHFTLGPDATAEPIVGYGRITPGV